MPRAPFASRRPHHVASPHGAREDWYFWLRDDTRSDPEVLAHLEAENAYTDAVLQPVAQLQEALFEELRGRIKEDDSSVPVRFRGYWYATRYYVGTEYPVLLRWPDRAESVETVLLDGNRLAAGNTFFQLGGYSVSPDNRLLAYTMDTVGRRQYCLRIRDIETGRDLDDVVENVEADIVWASDSRTLLYIAKDPVTLAGRRVMRHRLGTSASEDVLVYEEEDERFDLGVSRSKSERYLFIAAESTDVSEWHFARADDPELKFTTFLPRVAGHEYQIDHLDERFYVRTNWLAKNYRLVTVEFAHHADRERWVDLVAHDPNVFIEDFDVFRNFVALDERSGGLRKIRLQYPDRAPEYLQASEPAYTMRLCFNPEPDTTRIRYLYSSLITPTTTFEFDTQTLEIRRLKREIVLGDFDPSQYVSEFIWVETRDAVRVPVSLVYRKSVTLDGTAPLYLYAYGAYGICSDPIFSSTTLSLLDRGFVYAIAHVRGGQELGREWYEAGRQHRKLNTFYDFIDVTDALVARGYAARDKVFAAGGSAGGLLVGAVMNLAPQKYAGVIAHVPFVDIVTTMLDESIPLTTLEYDEWGNPNDAADYEYMLGYSPYDNVTAQEYPPLLATTGLWDSQVQYFEPAKWLAKLRATKTDTNPVLLHVNLEAGHGGKSGRFEHLHEVAREYAFVIGLAQRHLR